MTSKSDDSIKSAIRRQAIDLLQAAPAGMRFTELRNRLAQEMPDVESNTLAGTLVGFSNDLPAEILKPSRGFYIHRKYGDADAKRPDVPPLPAIAAKHREIEFYLPFAQYLVTDLEECTRAIPLGGNKFGSKWGTPDVIGLREPERGSLISFPSEIVSAEIKTETTQLIVAFGQAVAYRLFSHKSYLVVPVTSSEEDVGRLDVLSRIVGIGLILFDSTAPTDPRFSIRVRAMKHEPDGFYLNECVRHVEKNLFG